MKIGDIYYDKTFIGPHDDHHEHMVIEIGKGPEPYAKFDSSLQVGLGPFDGEWSISWQQFQDEFSYVGNKMFDYPNYKQKG